MTWYQCECCGDEFMVDDPVSPAVKVCPRCREDLTDPPELPCDGDCRHCPNQGSCRDRGSPEE